MFSMLIIAPALALATVTAPAATVTPAGSTDTVAPAAAAKSHDGQRVCAESYMTGSRLPQRQCHTRAEWRAMGETDLADAR